MSTIKTPNKIQRALISLSDKTGIAAFARGLHELGVEIISTGNTAKTIADADIPVRKVSDVTGFPEIMNGRVKTLHPHIHGGLLANRAEPSHLEEADRLGIGLIDLVVVNLYPFRETINREGVTLDDAIENIDIGGPCMIRAAAKNFPAVGVVVNPQRYDSVLAEMKANNGSLSDTTRRDLAREAFAHTATYDAAIVDYLCTERDPEPLYRRPTVNLAFERTATLRYGENGHQEAGLYALASTRPKGLMDAIMHQGKELSYNNIQDFQSAWDIVLEFKVPAAVLIKHNNPCGVGLGSTLEEAFRKGYACDTVSAFGGIFAVNQVVDLATAQAISEVGFYEGVLAPGYEPDALELLKKKKNPRLLELPPADFFAPHPDWMLLPVRGGALIQTKDIAPEEPDTWRVVSKLQPTEQQMADMRFAWLVAKHVKSNAIVFCKDLATVGIGAGQMSRVDSSTLAGIKAGDKSRGAVMASDAFFPFRDGIDAANKVGIAAVIQPGGSIRDEEIIAAADEHGMTMIFTGRRHFRH